MAVQVAGKLAKARRRKGRVTAAASKSCVPPLKVFEAVRSANVVTYKITGGHTYRKGNYVTVAGVTDSSFNGSFPIANVLDSQRFTRSQTGADASSGGGTVQQEEQKFLKGLPKIIDHEGHQMAIGVRGLSLGVQPLQREIEIDFGNNTYERVERLLKFMSVRSLGPDVTPYKAPVELTMRAQLEAVDDSSNALLAQLTGDVLSVDATVSEEFQGDYELLEAALVEEDSAWFLDLDLLHYESSAFTDVAGTQPVLLPPTSADGLPDVSGPGNQSYRPTSDPLSATDAGTTATVNVAVFTMRYTGIALVSYPAASFTGKAFATLYFIYVKDPDRRGGDNVTYAISTTKEDALQDAGWVYVGSIRTPPDGGANTAGNQDGGTGAQSGLKIQVRPTVNAVATGASAQLTTPAKAYDVDSSTFAFGTDSTALNLAKGTKFSIFGSLNIPAAQAVQLHVISDVVKNGAGTVQARIRYSVNGGSIWIDIYSVNANRAKTEDIINLPNGSDLSSIQVEALADYVSGVSTDITIDVYELWVEAVI